MENSLCSFNKYFDLLSKIGYIDYTSTFNIVIYIALKELLASWDIISEKDKQYIIRKIKELENEECILSFCNSCGVGNIKNKYDKNMAFGFLDTPYYHCADGSVKFITYSGSCPAVYSTSPFQLLMIEEIPDIELPNNN